MIVKELVVENSTGLHARPASDFVKLAGTFDCEVSIEKESKKVNAKSILGLLSLGVTKGTKINIITDGSDEKIAMEKIVEFITNLKE